MLSERLRGQAINISPPAKHSKQATEWGESPLKTHRFRRELRQCSTTNQQIQRTHNARLATHDFPLKNLSLTLTNLMNIPLVPYRPLKIYSQSNVFNIVHKIWRVLIAIKLFYYTTITANHLFHRWIFFHFLSMLSRTCTYPPQTTIWWCTTLASDLPYNDL